MRRPANDVVESFDPATGTRLARYPVTTRAGIARAVEEASCAQRHWAQLEVGERAGRLAPLVHHLRDAAPSLAEAVTRETGKPAREAREELADAAAEVGEMVRRAPVSLSTRTLEEEPDASHLQAWQPVGTAAVIAPFNYPVEIALWGIVANLLCGNAVVFKPSELTIETGSALVDLVRRLELPEGLVATVVGSGEQGRWLVEADVDLVWFVGSSTAGADVYARAARGFKRCVLELGGSSPCVIFDDVAVTDELVDDIVAARFTNCGQVCSAIKRLFVHEKVFGELRDALVDRVAALTVGHPADDTTAIGPLASTRSRDTVDRQVASTVAAGAQPLCGGYPLDTTGAYYPPTLLVDVPDGTPVLRQEVFGPVLPIVMFGDEAQAVRAANDSDFGLSASVYSGDGERAERVARGMKAGRLLVNATKTPGVGFPVEGFGRSGVGRHQGDWAFWDLSRLQYRKIGSGRKDSRRP